MYIGYNLWFIYKVTNYSFDLTVEIFFFYFDKKKKYNKIFVVTVRFMYFHVGNDNRDYKFSKLATELFYSNGFILILQAKLGNSNKKIHCLSYLHLVQYSQSVKIKELQHWFLLQQI